MKSVFAITTTPATVGATSAAINAESKPPGRRPFSPPVGPLRAV